MNSLGWLVIGFGMILAGFILPLVMVLRVIEPGFTLSFSGYILSLSGLCATLHGASQFAGAKKTAATNE